MDGEAAREVQARGRTPRRRPKPDPPPGAKPPSFLRRFSCARAHRRAGMEAKVLAWERRPGPQGEQKLLGICKKREEGPELTGKEEKGKRAPDPICTLQSSVKLCLACPKVFHSIQPSQNSLIQATVPTQFHPFIRHRLSFVHFIHSQTPGAINLSPRFGPAGANLQLMNGPSGSLWPEENNKQITWKEEAIHPLHQGHFSF